MSPSDEALPAPISVTGWPRPSGYSNGMTGRGTIVVTAGQIGWDPVNMSFASDDFADQCAQALRNVVAVLTAAGAQPGHLVRLTWYVTSREAYMNAAASVGAAYRTIVGRHYPAMAVVIVAGLVEPRAQVEIEATAIIPDAPTRKTPR